MTNTAATFHYNFDVRSQSRLWCDHKNARSSTLRKTRVRKNRRMSIFAYYLQRAINIYENLHVHRAIRAGYIRVVQDWHRFQRDSMSYH